MTDRRKTVLMWLLRDLEDANITGYKPKKRQQQRQQHHHHLHHVTLLSQIFQTLSHHLSLSPTAPGRSSRLHPLSVQSFSIYKFSWSSNLCSSMCGGPQDYITYEFVPTSPAVSRMSGLSNLDSFRDGRLCPYSSCFVGCYLQDLFNIARSTLTTTTTNKQNNKNYKNKKIKRGKTIVWTLQKTN